MTPATAAGRALLDDIEGIGWYDGDYPTEAILAIEAEARDAVLAEVTRRVEARPRLAWQKTGMDGMFGTRPDGEYLDRAAVLAIIAETPA